MEWIAIFSRWFHVGTAIVLLGGSVFMRFVLAPAAGELPEEPHQKLREGLLARWKKFVHGGIALLLLTGGYNYYLQILALREMPAEYRKQYHMLMGIKILIALAMFAVASILVGRSASAARMRQNPRRALGLVVLLGVLIVGISGYLRVKGTSVLKSMVAKPAAAAKE